MTLCMTVELKEMFAVDHVAVTLYLEAKAAALTLHIPAVWESTGDSGRFKDNGKPSQSNPGKVANKLHKVFSEKIKEETLKQIESCRYLGAQLKVHDGFKKRNDIVAKSPYLIAFSWGKGDSPTKGGTLDTWSKCTGKKVHIPLSSLEESTTACPYQESLSSVKICTIPKVNEEPCTPESLNSAEICSSLPATHAELCQPQTLGSQSKELPPSSSGTVKFPLSEYNLGSESLDSGVGSFDSCDNSMSREGTHAQHRHHEGQSKRKRSESADTLEDSDIECDGGVQAKYSTSRSVSKKLKLSDFVEQVLPTKK